MNVTERRPGTQQQFLLPARYFSRLFAPALILCVLVILAGFRAGLPAWGVLVLLAGTAVIPGLLYKKAKPLFRRLNLPDNARTGVVTALMGLATLVCYLLQLPDPVPATVGALFVGNAGLVFFRRWLNVSAHVSVITFGVLWITAIYGGLWSCLLVLSPLMLISRVSLREHSLREALSGASLGLATFCCFLAATTWS